MSFNQIKFFSLSVLLLFSLASCGGNPQEEARVKLGQMNVKYNEESFVDAARNGDVIALKYFLQAGMKPSVTDNKSETALIAAAKGGRTEVVELLLAHGADVKTTDKQFGATPLIWASISGNADTVKLLLDKGADLEVREEKNGMNAILVASVRGQTEIVKLLAEKGADVNSRDRDGRTPLIWAAYGGQIETVKLLLDKGADINVRESSEGTTPLMSAASRGQSEVVKLLLDKGADLDVQDKSGKTALSYARAAQKRDIEEMLLKAGAIPVKEESKEEKPPSALQPETKEKPE